MSIKVRVPLSLHRLTENKTEFECQGDSVEELFTNLNSQYLGLREILWDEEGRINNSFSLFVNGRNVRLLKKEKILLKDGDKILIMQLIAGG